MPRELRVSHPAQGVYRGLLHVFVLVAQELEERLDSLLVAEPAQRGRGGRARVPVLVRQKRYQEADDPRVARGAEYLGRGRPDDRVFVRQKEQQRLYPVQGYLRQGIERGFPAVVVKEQPRQR